MSINYLYRKGRIVTITNVSYRGRICKVLARPGQIVYIPNTEETYELQKYEYVVHYNELRIQDADYTATLHHGMCTLFPGILINELHLVPSTPYEKRLRYKGISMSPDYITEEPEGNKNEVLVFKEALLHKAKPRVVTILSADFTDDSPTFELSNGEHINRGLLKHLYRKPKPHEKDYCLNQLNKIINSSFKREETYNLQVRIAT